MKRTRSILATLTIVAVLSLIGPIRAQEAPPAAAPAEVPDAPPTDAQWQAALKVVRDLATDANLTPERRSAAIAAYVKMQMSYEKGSIDEAIKACQEVFRNPHDAPVAETAVRAACLVQRHAGGNLAACVDLAGKWRASGAGPASVQGAATVYNDLVRFRESLIQAAGRNPVPEAPRPSMPPWGRPGANGPAVLPQSPPKVPTPPFVAVAPEKGPTALGVALPSSPAPPLLKPDPKTGHSSALQLALPTYPAPPHVVPDAKTGELPALRGVAFPIYVPPAWYAGVRFPPLKE